MTATVGTLLDAAHAMAWGLCSRVGEPEPSTGGEDRAEGLLVAWPRLAAATLRVLDALTPDPVWLDDTGSVRDVLAELARRPRNATPGQAAATQVSFPDRDVTAIAVRLGLIADLLAGEPPARTEMDRAALAGLHANVVAVVHAVGLATLAALDVRPDTFADRWLMRGVLLRTERFAVRPTELRTGRYEDLVAVLSDGSVDAVIAGWVKATVDVLSSRQRVTQAALQVAAGDALILTATAATVCAAASQVGIVTADRAAAATSALTAAHAAWRGPMSWPATVRLEGVRDLGHTRASRALRQVITESLREGRDWLPADVLADRFDLGGLMAGMRRGLHAVGNVAVAHFQAMDTLVRGPGRLWMNAGAVTQPAYRGYATIEAACRDGWVMMPPLEPAGAELLTDAKRALTATTRGGRRPRRHRDHLRRVDRPGRGGVAVGAGPDRRLPAPGAACPVRDRPLDRPIGRPGTTTGPGPGGATPPPGPPPMTPGSSSPPAGEDVDDWALTRRISPRRVVRAATRDSDGQVLNSYPLIHPIAGLRPLTPWAVHLADTAGEFHLVCADLDAKTSPQAAADDAARLARLLAEVGLPHVVCASGPTGGRHVWLALCEPVDAVLVSALAHLLKAWLPTLDLSPLLNPATGCVRPPGSPQRLGGVSQVIFGAVSGLTHPTVTADQVRALVARLAERVHTLLPEQSGRLRPVAVSDGTPFLTGPKRPLSASCRTALETPPSGDLSAVLWRVLCGAAAARWRFEDLAAIADAPGLEHARTLRTGATRSPRPATGAASPAAVLGRQWTRAVHKVAQLASDPRPEGTDASFDVRAETVAELVRTVQGGADASAGRWGSSRSGCAQRRVLDALCLYHLQAVRPDAVEADIRRLALTCGLDRETARRSLLALAADGWIARTHPSLGRRGARWTIDPTGAVHTRISRMLSQAVPRPASTGAALRTALEYELADRLKTSSHDAFAPRGGLGLEAGSSYARLDAPTDTLEVAQLMGWTMVKTTRILERLASHGLLACDAGWWQQSDEDRLDRVSVEFGTAGRYEQRAARYAAERASWAWWQAELAWMRAPLLTSRANRQAALRAAEGGGGWPPHPRRSDGRAEFTAARRLLEPGPHDHVHGPSRTLPRPCRLADEPVGGRDVHSAKRPRKML